MIWLLPSKQEEAVISIAVVILNQWKWYDLTGPSKQEEAVISIAIVILNLVCQIKERDGG